MKNLKKISSQRFSFLFPLFTAIIISGLFFWKVFLLGYAALPADFIVGVYHPWIDEKWDGYPAGVPVKNPITTDVVSFTFPMRILAAEMLKEGQLPLWNPHILAGTPLLANFQSAPFSPTILFYFFTDKVSAWNLQVIAQHILLIFNTYLLLRFWKLSKLAALFGGVTFAFSGFNLIWSQWNAHALTASFLPLIILFTQKFFETKKQIFGFLLSLTLALQILSGYPQLLIYTFASIAISVVTYSNIQNCKIRILNLTIYVFLGLCLAAIQLFPGYELIKFSQRAIEPHPYGWAFLPFSKTITFIAPDYFGNHSTSNYWGPQDYTSNTGFVGVVALMLSLIALRKIKVNKNILLATLISLSGLALSYPTFISIFIWQKGFFGLNAASSHRALVLWCLGISFLAAFGFDQLRKDKKIFKNKPLLAFLLAFTSVCFYTVLNFFLSRSNPIFIHNIDISFIATKNLIFPSVIFILVLLFIKFRLRSLLFLLLILELFRFGWKFTPLTPRYLVFPPTHITNFLSNQQQPFRTTGSSVIPVNLRMPYKIESLEGYDAIYPSSIAQYIASLNSNNIDSDPQGRYAIVNNISSNLLDLSNVKYTIVLKENILPNQNYKEVYNYGPVSILENQKSLPRAFMVYNWEVSDQKSVLNKIINSSFDNEIYLEENPQITINPSLKISPVNYKLYTENKSIIDINSKSDGMLYVSDLYYPGWKAYIDNHEIAIYRANYTFRAIAVPSGIHEVKFIYEPKSFSLGLKISLLSFSLLLLFVLIDKAYTKNNEKK